MGHPTKIVTCCYCGTRAALVLKGKTRHELACSSCGAPLHDLKMLPKARKGDRELVPPSAYREAQANAQKKRKGKRRKVRKGWMSELLEEAFDVIEDIFD